MNDLKPSSRKPSVLSDRVHSAIRHPFNTLFMSIAVASSAALNSPWPLAAGLAAELIYVAVSIGLRRSEHDSQSSVSAPVTGGSRPTVTHVKATRARSRPSVASVKYKPSDMTGQAQERYLRIEATFSLIKLQVDGSKPPYSILLASLQVLMERFVLFASQEERLCDRLLAFEAEAQGMKRAQKLGPGVADLHLVYSVGDRQTESLEAWVQSRAQHAHEGFERELGAITVRREATTDPTETSALEELGRGILRKNHHVDKLAKTIINVHYELLLLDRKFELISQELSTRRPEQVLSDVNALVVQTQSLARTVEELYPGIGSLASAAA